MSVQMFPCFVEIFLCAIKFSIRSIVVIDQETGSCAWKSPHLARHSLLELPAACFSRSVQIQGTLTVDHSCAYQYLF